MYFVLPLNTSVSGYTCIYQSITWCKCTFYFPWVHQYQDTPVSIYQSITWFKCTLYFHWIHQYQDTPVSIYQSITWFKCTLYFHWIHQYQGTCIYLSVYNLIQMYFVLSLNLSVSGYLYLSVYNLMQMYFVLPLNKLVSGYTCIYQSIPWCKCILYFH